MTKWPMVKLGDVLQLQRRWVKVDPLQTYEEIGVRCFGNGIFHKAPSMEALWGTNECCESNLETLCLTMSSLGKGP